MQKPAGKRKHETPQPPAATTAAAGAEERSKAPRLPPGVSLAQAKADEWLYAAAVNPEASLGYNLDERIRNYPTDVPFTEWPVIKSIAERSATERAPSFTMLVFSVDVDLPRTTEEYRRVLQEVQRDPSLSGDALWEAFAGWLYAFGLSSSRNFIVLGALARDELFNTAGVTSIAATRSARRRTMALAVCTRLRNAPSNKSLGYFLWRYAGLDVPLAARELAERDGFYSLKRGQNINDLEEDVFITDERFPREVCKLWADYSYCSVLGTGVYGITLNLARYNARVADPKHYAVKIQEITDRADASTLAYRELRCLYEVMLLARHWSANRIRHPFNHIRLFDWDRCNFSLSGRIMHLMNANELQEYGPDLQAAAAETDYQIIVEEFADGGTYEAFIESKPAVATSREFFAATMLQIFGFLYAVGVQADLIHGDLKPANVLISRVAINSPYTHLLYSGALDDTRVLRPHWVPIAHSLMLVFKIADYGLSRMNGVRVDRSNPESTWITPIGKPLRYWLPGIDMLCWAVMWLYEVCVIKHVDLSLLDAQVIEVLLYCLKPIEKLRAPARAEDPPPDLLVFNSAIKIVRNNLAPSVVRLQSALQSSLTHVYSKCNTFVDWIDSDETHGEQHLRQMFDLPLFHPYRTPPPRQSSKSLSMAGYSVTMMEEDEEEDATRSPPDQKNQPQEAKNM